MRAHGLALLSLAAVCFAAAPARSFVQYDVETEWQTPTQANDVIAHPQSSTPPVVVETGDFSFSGGPCPQVGTPNFLCAHLTGRADLVPGVSGSALSVHATSRIVRRDAVGGGPLFLFVDSRILMTGFTAAFPQPDVSFAAFYLGLRGTLVSGSSTPAVTAETTVEATLFAPDPHPINCLGDDCPPIIIHTTTDPHASDAWNPAEGLLTLRLATRARITSAVGVDGWDADSIADFGDTLSLLAIQPQDENHNPIAGHFVLPDGAGPGMMLEIASTPPPPPTTTSTLPGVSTTTTTTTLPGAIEVCGNCIDDDADGLVDFEAPACCPAAGERTFALRKARLVSAAGAASHLSVTASVGDTTLSDVAPGHDVFLQIHGGPTRFCARIPSDRLVLRHGKIAVFSDPKGTVTDASGITKMTLRASKHGLVVHLEGARTPLAAPAAGPIELVVAFRDAGGANRCASDTPTFRKSGKKGLRAP